MQTEGWIEDDRSCSHGVARLVGDGAPFEAGLDRLTEEQRDG